MSSRERGAWIHSNATFRFIKVVILTSTSSKPRGIHRGRANQPPTRRAAARRTARARQPNELARDARELRRVPHGGVPDAGVRGRQRRLPRRDRLRTPQAGHARHPLRHSDDVRPRRAGVLLASVRLTRVRPALGRPCVTELLFEHEFWLKPGRGLRNRAVALRRCR